MKTRTRRGLPFQRKLAAAAVASCFVSSVSLANPTGANVVRGTAAIHQAGNLLQITNSPNAIINWQSFSIGANEITRFLQQSPSSAVLNRVTTQNPSEILGSLQSRLLDGVTTGGRVFLINPNGILFGAGAQIDVGGLVASTLRMSDDDFLAGRMRFGDGLGKSVVNDGSIATGAGGSVYLIGSGVTNNGIIRSPQGEVILAAGNSVELVSPGTPNLRVEIAATDNEARNLGQIISEAGRIGIYAGLITQSGVIRANTAAVTEDGRIVLKATNGVTLSEDSSTTATGPKGGSISLETETGTIRVAGQLDATGSETAGGSINIAVASEPGAVDLGTGLNAGNAALNLSGTGHTTTLNASIVTAGAPITINDSVILGIPLTITLDTTNGGAVAGGANITITGAIDDNLVPSNLVLQSGTAGVSNLGGPIGSARPIASLTASGNAVVLGGGAVTTTGAQTYNARVILGADTVMSATNVTFANLLDSNLLPRALTINTSGGGITAFGGAVGNTSALRSLTTNADGTTVISGGSITTVGLIGDQTFNDAVVLGADTTLSGNDITFNSTVNSAGLIPRALTVNTNNNGVTTFGGAVGGTAPLRSLTTNADGATVISGGSITTTGLIGDQTFNDRVILGADTILGGNDINFNSTVDSDATPRALAIVSNNNGATIFGGAVGSTSALALLATNADGSTAINGSTVQTTGPQVYADAVTMTGPATLAATGASGSISFGSSLGINGDLTLSAREINFGGGANSVSGNGALSLRPEADAVPVVIGGIADSGAGTLDLTAGDIAALANGFSMITMGRPAGTHAITVDAAGAGFKDSVTIQAPGIGGSITVNGTLSTTAGGDAASVTLSGSGATTTLNAHIVTAGGAIAINDSVVLGTPFTVNLDTTNGGAVATGANVTVTGSVNDDGGAQTGLAIAAGTGTVDLQGAVGAAQALPHFTVSSAGAVNLPAVTIGLGGIFITATGVTTLNGAVSAASATVDINSGGVAQNPGAAISAVALRLRGSGTFNLTQANDVHVLAANVAGPLSYADVSQLSVASVLGMTGIDTAGNALTLTTGGPLFIGSNVASGSQTIVSAGDITVHAGASGVSVSATGPQSITAGGRLSVEAGFGSQSNLSASITSSGGQTISATDILLAGGFNNGSGNFAEIRQTGPLAGQTINASNSILIVGGDVGPNNFAGIRNDGTGMQTIGGSPNIRLIGGTGGLPDQGNFAQIRAAGPQVITAGNTSLTAGASGFSNFADISSPNQDITVHGNLTLTGGGSSAGATNGGGARIGGHGGDAPSPTNLMLVVDDNVFMNGGTEVNEGAVIGSNFRGGQTTDITMHVVGGNLTMNPDAVANSGTRIGSPSDNPAGGTISIIAGGNIVLNGNPPSRTAIRTLGDVTLQANSIEQAADSVVQAYQLTTATTTGSNLGGANLVTSYSGSNATGAIILNDTAGGLSIAGSGVANGGDVAITTAGGALTVDADVTGMGVNLAGFGFANSATISGTGSILINANGETFTNNAGAVISGNGTLDATGTVFTNHGTLRPGGSGAVGTLNIVGDAVFSTTSVLEIEAQGATPGQYDVVAITGSAGLGGQLNVIPINGYVPAFADTLVPVTFGSSTGTFTVNPADTWLETYNATNLTLFFSLVNRWVDATGDWGIDTNWSLGHVPTREERALIDVPGLQTVTVSNGERAAFMLTSNENFSITGGSLDLGGASVLNGAFNLSGGSLRGPGSVLVNGSFNWTGGTLKGSGAFTTAGLSTLDPLYDKLEVSRNWTNRGTVQWVASHARDWYILEGSTFTNAAGATVNLDASSGSSIKGEGSFVNEGTLNKNSDGKTSIWPSFTNLGTINVNDGTLRLKHSTGNDGTINIGKYGTLRLYEYHYSNRGLLAGTGTLDARDVKFINDGTVAPGSSGGAGIGTLTIEGDYHQSANGVLLMGVAGTASGQYDVLEIGGKAYLEGTLSVSAVGSYVPNVGDTFRLITYKSRTDTLDVLDGPAGFDLSVSYQKKYATFKLLPD